MNLLLENGLPEEIDGVPIYADFRNMVRFEQILFDDGLTETEKATLGLAQLFAHLPPGGAQQATEKLLWFYSCGETPPAGKPQTTRTARAYDFDKDAKYIYAGFYAAYGIALTTVPFLHWWEFMALLQSLPDTTLMGQIMRWRTVELAQIKDKHTRAYYSDMKRRFALPRRTAAHVPSATELTRANKERVARRFEEAAQAANRRG